MFYTSEIKKSEVIFPTFKKKKLNFTTGLTIINVNIEHLESATRQFLRNVFMLTVVKMATVELMIGIF